MCFLSVLGIFPFLNHCIANNAIKGDTTGLFETSGYILNKDMPLPSKNSPFLPLRLNNTKIFVSIDSQEKLKEEDPNNLKAESFYHQGQRHKAIAIWERLLKKTPHHLPALNNLAAAYFNERRFKEAEALYLRLIPLDTRWAYPEARYFSALAHYQRYGALRKEHGAYLADYLAQEAPKYRLEAQRLRSIAIEPVASEKIGADNIHRIRGALTLSERNVIHFWAEWCTPCLRELTDLFNFRSKNPDIHYYIISLDSEIDQKRADRRLNALYAPFKKGGTENIHFLFDPQKVLWQAFIPAKDQHPFTVPRTVFLTGTRLVEYRSRQVNWEILDAARIWK